MESGFYLYLDGNPVEFLVSLNGGEEFSVPAYGDTGDFILAPDQVGENALTVYAKFEDVSVSPVRYWAFLVAG